MKLYDNWEEIVKRSWSLRFIILAGILSGIEIILPLFAEQFDRNLFAALSFCAVCLAFIARLIAQKGI